jgi:hypothetical protein
MSVTPIARNGSSAALPLSLSYTHLACDLLFARRLSDRSLQYADHALALFRISQLIVAPAEAGA